MGNLTLIADAGALAKRARQHLPAAFAIRPSTAGDIDQIGSLYFRSYEPGEACTTEREAAADVAASFDGEYGEYLPAASPVILNGPKVVAAAMTVKRAPWNDTPRCPFVIELFTAPEHRRAGLATALLVAAADATAAHDRSIALRVQDANTSAIALYDELGFAPWPG